MLTRPGQLTLASLLKVDSPDNLHGASARVGRRVKVLKCGKNPSEGRILKIAGHRAEETGARRVPGGVVSVAPQEIGIVKRIQELEAQFELHPFGNVAGLLNTPIGTEEMRSINENTAALLARSIAGF